MCWALLAFMISFNLFLPELNDFLTILGGKDLKGFIFFMFAISAGISRPFSGKLSDTIGRKKVMFIGVAIGLVAILSYPFSGAALIFLSLRFLHGFSAGFLPTGATALVTDQLPEKGRGVAMGIWGTFISVGFGVGNFFAGPIKDIIGLTGLFIVAAIFCLIAGIMISFVKETLPNPQKFHPKLLAVKWDDIFEPTVRPAAFIMFCSATSTGIMFVTSPDMSGYLGIDNKGWFFLFYMTSTILIRLFASKMSDNIGRERALIIGLSFMALSMTLLGTATEWIQYTAGATVFGISTGISSPTIFAWTADLSPEDRRGVGAGTVFIALEAAIMFGALVTLGIYDNSISTIPYCYLIGTAIAIIGVLYLFWYLKKYGSKRNLVLNSQESSEILDRNIDRDRIEQGEEDLK